MSARRRCSSRPTFPARSQRVLVHEGQHVAAGDALFEIDPVPFQLALQQAQSKLDTVHTDFANLKSNYQSLSQLVELGQQAVDLKQPRRRPQDLACRASSAGSQVDLDNAKAALLTAELQLAARPAAARAARSTSCSAIPICRSRNSPPISRPRPRSTRRSATSTTPCSRRRSPAPRRRSTTSSSAAS